MPILRYFVTTGTLLTGALLALNAYLDQSGGPNAAKIYLATTTASLLIEPTRPTKAAVTPDMPQPAAAASAPTPNSTHSAHHRRRVR